MMLSVFLLISSNFLCKIKIFCFNNTSNIDKLIFCGFICGCFVWFFFFPMKVSSGAGGNDSSQVFW